MNRLAGKLPTGCLTVRWVLPAPRCSVHVSPSVRAQALASTKGAVAALHASGMKTVKITHESLRKACVTRPSDAMVGKPTNGTATDWVTRGPLNLRATVGGMGA